MKWLHTSLLNWVYMFSCFAKLRQHLSDIFASRAHWASNRASSWQNCSSAIATASVSLVLFLYMLCFALKNLKWIFCISEVNATLIYDPQDLKALMEELPQPPKWKKKAGVPAIGSLALALSLDQGQRRSNPSAVELSQWHQRHWKTPGDGGCQGRTHLPTSVVILLRG